jgi:hypothetical protein
MKHGVVTNGRTATYYGNEATRFMARMSATYCNSQKQAVEMVENARGGHRKVLVEELQKLNYVFDKKWLDELYQKEEQEELEAQERARAKARAKYRAFPIEEKTTRSKCKLCGKFILKGAQYHDGGRVEGRAHVACAKEPSDAVSR